MTPSHVGVAKVLRQPQDRAGRCLARMIECCSGVDGVLERDQERLAVAATGVLSDAAVLVDDLRVRRVELVPPISKV